MDETVGVAAPGIAAEVGPPAASLLITLLETSPAFVIDAASFGVAAPAVFLVRGGRRAAPSGEHGERALVGMDRESIG